MLGILSMRDQLGTGAPMPPNATAKGPAQDLDGAKEPPGRQRMPTTNIMRL